jgi:octaheme c-type cytochrome (tetrathionate reductase family)
LVCHCAVPLLLALILGQTAGLRAASSSNPILPGRQPTANHESFDALKKEFKSGPEVTAACLSCHTEAAKQMMQTTHWTWRARTGGDATGTNRWIGKGAGVLNNFCLGMDSSEPRCTSCHAGYGWKDKSFDFTNEQNVDCLVCHDTTGTYRKFPTDAGHPNYVAKEWPKGSGKMVPPPDLGQVARHVGRTSRATCGSCHFFGGGSEGVKHGVLDASLVKPERAVDVHMHAGGANFSCTECHTTVNHQIAGRYFDHPAYEEREFVMRGANQSALGCETCHGKTPHTQQAKLNDHTDKVACQTCHIPLLAPSKPTKMWWDWSQAGRFDAAGKPLVEKARVSSDTAAPRDGAPEAVIYDGMKGSFLWAWKAVPEYAWFNNHLRQTVQGDRIDDSLPGAQTGATRGVFDRLDLSKPVVRINALEGGYHDPQARIWPVKIHRGIQPYDPVNKLLVVPKLFPNGTNADSAYWKSYQWPQAIEAGMRYANLPYSGRYEWMQTMMSWPLSHMVAPKEQSLQCADCHRPAGSRLAGLQGFYMPARDRSRVLDWLGWLAAIGTVGGVGVHGGLRFYCWRKRCRL